MELIILVGLPATGKSTFVRQRYEATHVIVSKDRLRNNSRPSRRQAQSISEALGRGSSVVVDNTNVGRAERASLIMQAREHGARVIGYYFPSSVRDSLARNAGRTGRGRVPDVAVRSKAGLLEPPTVSEGFDEVYQVVLEPPGFRVATCREGTDDH